MDADIVKLNEITHAINGCAFKVSTALGNGFVEKVYENALVHELRKAGLFVEQQRPLAVYYDGTLVGEFVADLLVERSVLAELKAVRMLDEVHRIQCVNYLKATGLKICLLLNFGAPRLQVKRIVNQLY